MQGNELEDCVAEGSSLYRYIPSSGEELHANADMLAEFSNNGFIVVKTLFSPDEIKAVYQAIDQSRDIWDHAFLVRDKHGLSFSVAQWTESGDDILGMCARTTKVVNICQELLNKGDIYLYCAKVLMKQPLTGGELSWHQDYGYWYHNGCLLPNFISCWIALTKSDRKNCNFEVIKSSHLCGRIDHKNGSADQKEADSCRIKLLLKAFERTHIDLDPGDAIFYHGNLLFRTDANKSEHNNWNLIFSYNSKDNSPDKEPFTNDVISIINHQLSGGNIFQSRSFSCYHDYCYH